MRILIASDKFKGSLPASRVAEIIARMLSTHIPDAECDLCPIADGGEGTTEAMISALGGEWITVDTVDACGRPLQARYGSAGDEAILEMSAASGLALVKDLPPAPATASTWGTGLMMRHAIARGARRLVIGIGGSATNDGGLGMAAALGHVFIDDEGGPVPPLMTAVPRISRILPPAVFDAKVLVACDVDNPLLGEKGATRVYGPQKGVRDLVWFEQRLAHLADLVARDLGRDPRNVPGAGAAGGLGFGLMAFCAAELVSGFDLVAAQVGLQERIAQADLVITGEGRLDAQTLHGKGPAGVAQMARRAGRPVAAFAGSIQDTPALRAHFDLAHAIKPPAMPLAEAIQRAEELLALAVADAVPHILKLPGLAKQG